MLQVLHVIVLTLKLVFLILLVQPSFTTLQPVSLDFSGNFDGPPSSPPVLLIDSTEEIISSQLSTFSPNIQNQSSSNINISRTPFTRKSIQHGFNNNRSYNSLKEIPIDINGEPMVLNDKSNLNRLKYIDKKDKYNLFILEHLQLLKNNLIHMHQHKMIQSWHRLNNLHAFQMNNDPPVVEHQHHRIFIVSNN